MSTAPLSQYPADTVWHWCPMDTQALYLQHRQSRPHVLRQHGWWDHTPIQYRFNSDGFRSDPLLPHGTAGVLFLGCSLTMGIGVYESDRWTNLVGKALGCAVWNLAQGGAAMDTCFRMAEYWVPRLRPVRVVWLCPQDRTEWLDAQGQSHLLLPSEQFGVTPQPKDVPAVFYQQHWMANPENSRLNDLKNLWAVQRLCDQQHIPLYHWHSLDMLTLPDGTSQYEQYSLGRDLAHPGRLLHRDFAHVVLDRIHREEHRQ